MSQLHWDCDCDLLDIQYNNYFISSDRSSKVIYTVGNTYIYYLHI